MLHRVITFLFAWIYLCVSSFSFADEIAVEVITDTPPPPIEEVVPEIVTSAVNTLPDPVIETLPVTPEVSVPREGVANDTWETWLEQLTESTITENIIDIFEAAPAETTNEILEEIPTTEAPTTTIVEVEENSIFTPPGPEPEPWQPPVRPDPTTESNTPIWNTETQSDPQFLAENSVFVRRMIQDVVVDAAAKHSCKVDLFHADISESSLSLLDVRFYGISMLASYEAEIGSLPNGVDVRFEKNNDYVYDFRGKETILQLVVTKQDSSLSGDFTIPIIYTHKGKKESTVICQLNIINEEEAALAPVLVPVVEPVIDPAQEVVDEILEVVLPEPEPVIETPTLIEEILDVVTIPVPETVPEIPVPELPPVELPPAVLPEPENEEVTPEPETENTENISTIEPILTPSSDVPST